MRSRHLSIALLTIGILGAYGANAAAAIKNSISNAQAAAIGRIAKINDIQRISDGIADISLIAIANNH